MLRQIYKIILKVIMFYAIIYCCILKIKHRLFFISLIIRDCDE